MTHSDDSKHKVLDPLVREYVERQAASLDAGPLIERIRERQKQGVAPAENFADTRLKKRNDRKSSWFRYVPWWGLSTLAIVVAFFFGRQFESSSANAAVILRDVQLEHARNVDHCYRVRFDPDPRYWNPGNPLTGPSISCLWTRGDRFWADCEIGTIRFKMGREAHGSVWIIPSQDKGIRFSNLPENLPRTVDQICQINSMSVPRLVHDVLADFDLTSHNTRDFSGKETTVIWAQLKPGRTNSLLRHALLEIDARTNILVRLVLWTVDEGKPRGTVAFTLLESATLDDRQYELESHLVSGATIETQSLPSPDYKPDGAESIETQEK